VHERRVGLVTDVVQVVKKVLVFRSIRVEVAKGVKESVGIGGQSLERTERRKRGNHQKVNNVEIKKQKRERKVDTIMYSTSSCASPPGSVWLLAKSPYTFSTGMVALGRPDSDRNFIRSELL
jgi:hypothetical protein